jgi:toxin FitB
MVAYLLDTNVVSELRKRTPNPDVLTWYQSARNAEAYISTLVVGEIRRGVDRMWENEPSRATVLEQWLVTLMTSYRDRTLAVTTEIAEEWGRLSASNPPPIIDGLMAATAKVHNLTFVTRNIADVERTGVSLLNPFRPGSTGS